MDEQMAREFRQRGVLKINYVALVGTKAFEGLAKALTDAEERSTSTPGSAAAEDNYSANVFFRLGPLFDHYPEVEAAVRAPRIGELAAHLAGVEHVRRWSDETFFKPPGSSPCAWHQDFPAYPMDRTGLLTVWVAMEDVREDMGPVSYFPGSHHLGPCGMPISEESRAISGAADPAALGTPDRFLRRGDTLEEPISFTLKAGEAVVHDGLVIHGGEGNRSDRMRRGWACIYFPSEARYTETPRRPEAEGIGLVPFGTFDHPKFPIIDY